MAKRKTKKNAISKAFFHSILDSKFLPYILCFAAVGILFVLIRMKGIEQQYQYNEITKKLEDVYFDNKDLKAKKARLLSIKNMKKFAKKHNLKTPSKKQIIVIP